MRNYVIDALSPEDCGRVSTHLRELGMESSLEGLFWIPVPASLLTSMQEEHLATCGPYAFGLSVENDSLSLELLVRARGVVHCSCPAYADAALRAHMMAWLDDLLLSLAVNG